MTYLIEAVASIIGWVEQQRNVVIFLASLVLNCPQAATKVHSELSLKNKDPWKDMNRFYSFFAGLVKYMGKCLHQVFKHIREKSPFSHFLWVKVWSCPHQIQTFHRSTWLAVYSQSTHVSKDEISNSTDFEAFKFRTISKIYLFDNKSFVQIYSNYLGCKNCQLFQKIAVNLHTKDKTSNKLDSNNIVRFKTVPNQE